MMQKIFKLKLLFIQVLVILPFLLFIFYLFDSWYDTQRTIVLENNANYARLTAGYVKDYIANSMLLAERLSKDETLIKNLEKDIPSAEKILTGFIQATDTIDSIIITNQNGQAIAGTLNLTDSQKDISITDRPYFQDILNTKTKTYSSPSYSKFSGKFVVIAGVPVILESEVKYIVNVYVSLHSLSSRLETYLKSDNNNVILLDRKGYIILVSGKGLLKEDDRKVMAEDKFVIDTLSGKSLFIENEKLPIISSDRFTGATVTVSELGWAVVSAQNARQLFDPITSVQKQLWLIVVLAMIFSFSIFSFFLRKLRLVF